MNEIVKYHNKLNSLSFGSLGELGQNLFFSMLTKLKDKADKEVIFTADELNSFVKERNLTNKELFIECNKLKYNIFKMDFKSIKKNDDNSLDIGYHNIFKSFFLRVTATESEQYAHLPSSYVPKEWELPQNVKFIKFKFLKVQINPEFAYLVNELTANFTRFELEEFIALSGKYTKTLYRLLKQYRQTGKRIFEWQEFAELMDIPADYRQTDIDQFILKPALKELTKERNLFDTTRIPFENLTCTKLNKNKKKCNKGDRVRHILFEWKPEERKIDCKDFYSDFAEKHRGKTFYFNGYGKFVFKGLGKNLEGDRIFIFENEEMARYSEKINDYPTKNSLEKLAKNIINA